jgi:hypothetical protein
VAKRILAKFLRIRSSRVLAIWGLILVQAQLLWVTELHHHGEDLMCQTSTVLARDAENPGSDSAQRPLCLACRIARESTAHAAAGFLAATPDSVVHLRAAHPLRHSAPSPVSVIPARAPPTR